MASAQGLTCPSSRLSIKPGPARTLKAALLAALLAVLPACQKTQSQPPKGRAPVPVSVATVARREVHPRITTTGVVKANQEARLAFEVGGTVERVFFDENDSVSAGAVLVRLDQTQIRARVAQAQVAARKAARDLERIRKLHEEHASPLSLLQDAASALESAEADLVVAQYALKRSEIRAPFTGRVALKLIREFELIGPGTPAFVLVGIKQVKVEVGLSDSDIGQVRVGDQATVRVDAYPLESFAGAVSRKAVAANGSSGAFKVEVLLDNPDERLLPGMIAHATIRVQPHPLLLVPLEAVSVDDSGRGALFLARGGHAYRREVVVARVLKREVAIQKGVAQGDSVVVKAAPGLKSGDALRVVR